MGAKTDTKQLTANQSTEQKNQVLQATIEVLPNAGYRAKGMYKVDGVGIYSGMYYAKKVTHTINSEGYSVVIEALRKDHPVGGTATTKSVGGNSTPPAATRNDRQKSNVGGVLVDQKTGNVTGR